MDEGETIDELQDAVEYENLIVDFVSERQQFIQKHIKKNRLILNIN